MALELTQRFRRHVAQYNVTQSLAVLSGSNYCPALQTIQSNGQPNIDRTSVPTVLMATVSATAEDSSAGVGSVTDSAIANIKWMVQRGDETQGQSIASHGSWSSGDYEIGTGNDKGKLYIRKNVPSGTTWKIWMECDIADQRRGYTVAIPVVTDSVLLYSISNADELYSLSIDRPSGEYYEPARDLRLMHEYLTGLGESHTLNDDGNTYLRVLHAVLRRGGKSVETSAYALKIYSVNALGVRTEVTAATDDCIVSVAGNAITLDLRFAKERTYQIACFVDGTEVAHKTYGFAWSDEMPTTNEGLVGGATYIDGDKQTYGVKLNLGKSLLTHPTIAFKMEWFYRKPGQTSVKVYVGSGDSQTYDLTASNMFNAGASDAVLEIEKRGVYSHIATSARNGGRYVDGSGNYYAEN